jgi:hypothetical protein
MKTPFSFVATTANQTVFGPIDISLEAVVTMGIDGEFQDPTGTDFTIGGIYLTLAAGVPVGTKIAGVLEI